MSNLRNGLIQAWSFSRTEHPQPTAIAMSAGKSESTSTTAVSRPGSMPRLRKKSSSLPGVPT